MEGNDRYVPRDLKTQIPGLDVHVRSLGSSRSNVIEHLLKRSLIFLASVGATRELAWVEDGGIVGKSSAKTVPLEIVECLDEIGKRVADLGLGAVRGDRIRMSTDRGFIGTQYTSESRSRRLLYNRITL